MSCYGHDDVVEADMDEGDDTHNSQRKTVPRKGSQYETYARHHIGYNRPQVNSISSFPEAPSASLNQNFPPPPAQRRLHRYQGDGLDLRRPIMSRQPQRPQKQESADVESADVQVVDLTSDSDTSTAQSPASAIAHNGSQQGPAVIDARRQPEVIDLDNEDEDDVIIEQVINRSPEVQFLREARRTDRPSRLQRPPAIPRETPTQQTGYPGSWLTGSFAQYAGFRGGLSGLGAFANTQYLTQALLRRTEAANVTDLDRLYRDLGGDPITPLGGMGDAHGGFQAPQIDFTVAGFNYQEPRQPPAGARYEAPKAPAEGYTRTTKEDDTIVCPKCDHELGAGNDPVKKQIWVIRACGHTYCGTCVTERQGKSKRRILTTCCASDCNTAIKAGKNGMFMLYI